MCNGQINVSGFSISEDDRSGAMVSVNDVYIEHGIIHIVRVGPHQKFKALLQGQPIILESRKDPYVFNDPTFRMAEATAEASFVSVNDKYISNQSLHEVRLDEGKVCLVWVNNKYVYVCELCLAGLGIPETTNRRRSHARVWPGCIDYTCAGRWCWDRRCCSAELRLTPWTLT